jgi:hypothetical protein
MLLTEEQKQQLRAMQRPALVGGPGRGGPPPGGTPVFRAYRYAINHPAFAGKKWEAGKSLEQLQAKEPDKKKEQTKN